MKGLSRKKAKASNKASQIKSDYCDIISRSCYLTPRDYLAPILVALNSNAAAATSRKINLHKKSQLTFSSTNERFRGDIVQYHSGYSR